MNVKTINIDRCAANLSLAAITTGAFFFGLGLGLGDPIMAVISALPLFAIAALTRACVRIFQPPSAVEV